MQRLCIAFFFVTLLCLSSAAAEQRLPVWSDDAKGAYSASEREGIGSRYLQEPVDFAQAILWYRSAAKAGSATARAYMGWFYEEGKGVQRDGQKAAYWYAQAVEAGAAMYSLHLAWMYLQGAIVDYDRAQADDWFAYAIEQGVSEAKLAYGSVLYADLLGGDDDPAKGARAEALLLEALADNQIYATRFLARMYFDGTGVEQDIERGLNAVRLGADAGDPVMQALLADIYAEGRLLEANLVKANTWAILAAAQGDQSAAALRQRLQQLLSDQEVQSSREQALEWARKHEP